MPDFQVPDWLQPMSEAEKARLDENAWAAGNKAAAMMKRQIGLSRMRDETQQAIQSGTDPTTARQNALLNNAHLLFSDNPEEIDRIVQSQDARAIRERALRQSEANLAETIRHHNDLAEQARATLEERRKYHEDRLKQDSLKKTEEYTPTILSVENPLTGKKIPVLRKSPTQSELLNAKVAPRMNEVDKAELRSIYDRIKDLQKAHDEIEPEQGAVKEHPNTIRRMRLNLEITKLRDRAKAIQSKSTESQSDEVLSTDEPPKETPPAEPKRIPTSDLKIGDKYRGLDGKVKTYKGVDDKGDLIWE